MKQALHFQTEFCTHCHPCCPQEYCQWSLSCGKRSRSCGRVGLAVPLLVNRMLPLRVPKERALRSSLATNVLSSSLHFLLMTSLTGLLTKPTSEGFLRRQRLVGKLLQINEERIDALVSAAFLFLHAKRIAAVVQRTTKSGCQTLRSPGFAISQQTLR